MEQETLETAPKSEPITIGNHTFYMDGYLRTNLDVAKKVIKKDWDMVFLYDGTEGGGKSVKAMQDAYYCDPSLVLDRITFTPNEFRKAIMNAEKYQSVVYDEAFTGLSSREAMGAINRILVKMLAEIRQKNLFVFVVMPTFFDLDKYAALWRSRALLHVYCADGFERGYFAFYNSEKKKMLYISGKKYYSYMQPKPNFIGRFTNYYVLDEREYREKKQKSLVKRENQVEESEIKRQVMAMLFNRLQNLTFDLDEMKKAEILSMPRSTYYIYLRRYNESKNKGE